MAERTPKRSPAFPYAVALLGILAGAWICVLLWLIAQAPDTINHEIRSFGVILLVTVPATLLWEPLLKWSGWAKPVADRIGRTLLVGFFVALTNVDEDPALNGGLFEFARDFVLAVVLFVLLEQAYIWLRTKWKARKRQS